MPRKDRLFLIDATALAYRAHFAFLKNPLTSSKGLNTSAAFGFTNIVLKLLDEERPELCALVFDAPTKTFRHAKFPDYKATREKMPEEMGDALRSIDVIVAGLGVPRIAVPGYEADDVIGTLARRAEALGLEVAIVTSDKDMLQLVGERVKVWNPYAGGRRASGSEIAVLGPKEVEEKLGVPPARVRDLLALMGDASDNVPGVLGVGEKTARALIERFGSVDEVYRRIEEVEPPRIREALRAHEADARLSLELVTIATDAPVELGPRDLAPRPQDRLALSAVFQELEFRDLLRRFSADVSNDPHVHRVAETDEQLDALLRELRDAPEVVFDLETTGLSPLACEVVGMSFSTKPGEAVYVPARERPSAGGTYSLFPVKLDFASRLEKLRPILEDPTRPKGGQNVKFDMLVLEQLGLRVQGIAFDTLLESYLLDPSARAHNLDDLALRYLNYKKITTESVIGAGRKQRTMFDAPVHEVASYASEDADMTLRLHRLFKPRIEAEPGLASLYREVELPLLHVLLGMERTGVKVDLEVLGDLGREFDARLRVLAEECFALAGGPFNLGSPRQLAQVFDRLDVWRKAGLRAKRTATGAVSTDAEVLERLAEHHPLAEKVLEHRLYEKLRGTYVDALPKLVNPRTGRVHTSFNQAVAATGRLSSSDPNLQNIPIRTAEGRRIRSAFVAGEPGWLLLSADYSQIELRLLAHLSGDEALREAFRAGADVHRATAARIFGLAPEAVTPELRGRAKAINFGVIYGMGPGRLGRETGMSYAEAELFIKGYFEKYPKVKTFLDAQVERARREGSVETILKRRRSIPEIWSQNRQIQMQAERIAANTPIQGSAADLVKVAMIRIDRRLGEERYPARMLLQVHDELLFEVEAGRADELERIVRHEMSHAVSIDVPLQVDVGRGRSWLEAHG